MKLSRDQVDSEIEKYSGQLSKILDYVDKLNEVDTSEVEPTFNVMGLSNVMAEDESSSSLTQDQTLANGSETKDGLFVTKGVFDNE